MNSKKFILGKAPYIRKADLTSQHTSGFMKDLMIALIPLIIFGWVKNGLLPFIDDKTTVWGMLYPLLLPLLGGLFSTLLELGWWGFIIKKRPLRDQMKISYALIPGLMLGMIVPISTPIWTLFIGTIFATVIAKLIFGGFGHNIFNPALIGFVFLTTYYTGVIGGTTGFGAVGYLNPSEVGTIVSGATPLTEVGNTLLHPNIFAGYEAVMEQYGLLKLFLGFNPGAIAETSALLCLLALVYLLVRKVTNWRIPVIYIGTVFVLTFIIALVNKPVGGPLNYALFNIFTGGLMFGAVFMATEPVTSPRNPNGKVIYALALGILTVVFRFASSNPEGVAVSILVLNMFTAIIERFATKIRVEPNKKKVILSYSLVGLLLAGISVFPIVKSVTPEVEVAAYEFVSKEQDYKSFDFVYTIKSDGTEFTVTTNQAFEIKAISDFEFDNAEAKTAINTIIGENKLVEYIQSANEGVNFLELNVVTAGFNAPIYSKITYNDTFVITAFSVTYNETYTSWDDWKDQSNNIHPKDTLPAKIVEKQGELTDSDLVAGATSTSKAVVKSVSVAKGYIDYLGEITELTLVGKAQDLNTLEFTYVFRHADGKLLVKTNTNHEIQGVVDAEYLTAVETLIAANTFTDYIVSKTATTVVVKTKGFASTLTTVFTYDSEYKITGVEVDTESESYEDGEWSYGDQVNPDTFLPGEIIENQNDLNNMELVSGATGTSKSIQRAASLALEYLKNLEGANE